MGRSAYLQRKGEIENLEPNSRKVKSKVSLIRRRGKRGKKEC